MSQLVFDERGGAADRGDLPDRRRRAPPRDRARGARGRARGADPRRWLRAGLLLRRAARATWRRRARSWVSTAARPCSRSPRGAAPGTTTSSSARRDAASLPVEDADFDAAISVQVQEYVPEVTTRPRASCTGRCGRAAGCSCSTSTGRRCRVHSEDAGAHRARAARLGRAPGAPVAAAHARPAPALGRLRGRPHGGSPVRRRSTSIPDSYGAALVPFIGAFVAGRQGLTEADAAGLGGRAARARRARRVLLRGHAVLLHGAEAR